MVNRPALLTIAVCLALLSGAPSVTRSDTMTSRVDALFAPWAKPDSPGCGVGVSQNGTIVYEHGYGTANLDLGVPITPSTVFSVASISKQFTAMSILLLAQRGKLSLDDDVRKYIPELPDYGTRMTVRHLLTHTSGLRDVFLLMGLGAPQGDSVDTNELVVKTLARQRALVTQPGTRFSYNNGGYTLLGRIVTRVSGQSLGAFADANIFKPLGMTHTHFHEDGRMIVANRATGYERVGDTFRLAPHGADGGGPVGLVGNSGVMSTIADLLRWEQNLANPHVGDPKLIAEMQTAATLTTGEPVPYGYGLFINSHHGLKTVEHGGGGQGVSAWLGRFPERGLAIAVVCNLDNVEAGTLSMGVADLYLGASPETPSKASAPPAVTLSATQLASRVGLYRSLDSRAFLRLVVRDGQLKGITSAGEDGDSFPLTPLSATRFVIPNTEVVLEFTPTAPGQPQEARVTGESPKGDVLRQIIETKITPSASELRAFAGAYRSDELDVTYTAVLRPSGLVFEVPGGGDIALQPIYPDAFHGGGVDVVEFVRDAQGAITGFGVYAGGAPGLRFTRVATR
jgi:CubicO group peptidase (beta-lactamase class C family)